LCQTNWELNCGAKCEFGGKCESAQLTRFRQVQQAGKSAENGGAQPNGDGAKAKAKATEKAKASAQNGGPAEEEDSPSQRAGVY